MGHHNLNALGKKILTMTAEDARTPLLEIARACNVSGAAIHRRVQKLINLRVIKSSGFIFDPEEIGYETCAFAGLYLGGPGDPDRVADELKKIPEVVECHCPAGDYDLFIKLYTTNNHHPMSIIYDKLQPLGLSGSETIISFCIVIDCQLPVAQMKIEERSEIADEGADPEPWLYEKETTSNITGGR